MTDTRAKIAAGLERAFAARGFAEPSVEDLRAAAGVSLRTLYKYLPSRGAMVHAALEHRHQRYLEHVFAAEPGRGAAALETLIDRIAAWLAREAAHGCLFHAAVAAAPDDASLHAILERHKTEVARRAAAIAALPDRDVDLTLIFDGLAQSWPLNGARAVESAKRLARTLAAPAA